MNLKSSPASLSRSDELTVGEVARRAGFATSAVRYYESEGLIEATRSPGGQRRYQRSVLRRLAFIRAAQNVVSRRDVRALVAPTARSPPLWPCATA